MAYQKQTIDLSVANTNKVQIVPPGQTVNEVFAIQFPAGALLGLAFGSGEAIPIDRPFSFKPTEDEGNYGLFYTVPTAQPGSTVDLWIVSGGATVGAIG